MELARQVDRRHRRNGRPASRRRAQRVGGRQLLMPPPVELVRGKLLPLFFPQRFFFPAPLPTHQDSGFLFRSCCSARKARDGAGARAPIASAQLHSLSHSCGRSALPQRRRRRCRRRLAHRRLWRVRRRCSRSSSSPSPRHASPHRSAARVTRRHVESSPALHCRAATGARQRMATLRLRARMCERSATGSR